MQVATGGKAKWKGADFSWKRNDRVWGEGSRHEEVNNRKNISKPHGYKNTSGEVSFPGRWSDTSP